MGLTASGLLLAELVALIAVVREVNFDAKLLSDTVDTLATSTDNASNKFPVNIEFRRLCMYNVSSRSW
jgi:hypothetical protein